MFVVKRQNLLGKRYYKIVNRLEKNEVSYFEGTKSQCQDYIEGITNPEKTYRETVNDELTRELNELKMCPCGFYLKHKCVCK